MWLDHGQIFNNTLHYVVQCLLEGGAYYEVALNRIWKPMVEYFFEGGIYLRSSTYLKKYGISCLKKIFYCHLYFLNKIELKKNHPYLSIKLCPCSSLLLKFTSSVKRVASLPINRNDVLKSNNLKCSLLHSSLDVAFNAAKCKILSSWANHFKKYCTSKDQKDSPIL